MMGDTGRWLEWAILTYSCTILPIQLGIFCFPLLVLMKVSATVRYFWFAFVFPHLASRLKKHFKDPKSVLFGPLKNEQNANMVILEIGIGTGANFDHYPKNCRLIAVDINPYFGEDLNKSLKSFPGIKVDQMVISGAEDLSAIDSNSVDIVVCTHVLCSVANEKQALSELCRVLKQGGKLYLMEHVGSRSPSGTSKVLQTIVEPFWSPFTGGCKMTRDPADTLRSLGFHGVDNLTYLDMKELPITLGPHIFGVLTK